MLIKKGENLANPSEAQQLQGFHPYIYKTFVTRIYRETFDRVFEISSQLVELEFNLPLPQGGVFFRGVLGFTPRWFEHHLARSRASLGF